ncbi:hypothetical protein AKJ16_DCAP04471, partial [Drosera capensis]
DYAYLSYPSPSLLLLSLISPTSPPFPFLSLLLLPRQPPPHRHHRQPRRSTLLPAAPTSLPFTFLFPSPACHDHHQHHHRRQPRHAAAACLLPSPTICLPAAVVTAASSFPGRTLPRPSRLLPQPPLTEKNTTIPGSDTSHIQMTTERPSSKLMLRIASPRK